jgi:hypothetical protein
MAGLVTRLCGATIKVRAFSSRLSRYNKAFADALVEAIDLSGLYWDHSDAQVRERDERERELSANARKFGHMAHRQRERTAPRQLPQLLLQARQPSSARQSTRADALEGLENRVLRGVAAPSGAFDVSTHGETRPGAVAGIQGVFRCSVNVQVGHRKGQALACLPLLCVSWPSAA